VCRANHDEADVAGQSRVRPIKQLPRATWLRLVTLLVLAIAGCGGGNRPVAVGSGPLGCTHRLVFARNGSANGRMVALSFDDTPSPYTEGIFKTLLQYHVTGTFFVIGDQIDGNTSLLHAMVDDGMELGNHSYNHPRDLPNEGEGASLQLELTNLEIERASGFEPCLFRPPYGNLTPELIQRAKVLGMTTVKWDVDPEDWRHPGVGVIRERVLSGVRPGAIVVMHDNIETHGQTVEALPGIIEGLEARGFRVVTITQLLSDSFVLSHPHPHRYRRSAEPVRGSEGE
jgi:peptidoglycan-N-acetylglucosamine deacetylase